MRRRNRPGTVSAAARPQRNEPAPPNQPAAAASTVEAEPRGESPSWGRRYWLAAAGLLVLHYALAASSLVRENPTVDEVLHLPAGISYWQTGSFKLYRHNPPLVKLVAAAPALLMKPETESIYQSGRGWQAEYPSQATFGQYFQLYNAQRFFEIFTVSRLVMPLFSVLGGVVVLLWSRRLFGPVGGLLSLTLWCLCPNILAHARLVTSDVGAAALGCAATYLFWRYLKEPGWVRAGAAGVVLGLALLSKFSSLVLYGLLPFLWVVHELLTRSRVGLARRTAQVGAALLISVLVIDAGYLFEGVGTPLGRFDFASRSFLTRPGSDPRWRNHPSGNNLIDLSWRHRVNRFRGTWLGSIPSPLPRHFLMGFDEQKIEADGIPLQWTDPSVADPNTISGYPVYLDGVIRRTGWRDYYLKTLLYKLPEGTWVLLAWSAGLALLGWRRHILSFDTLALALVPLVLFVSMTFLTDINLGLRYVLPIFPYMYISCGIVGSWVERAVGRGRPVAAGWARWPLLALAVPLAATALAVGSIHPHYLAYFNRVSGGPRNGSRHLIDSNLDWGQDLVGLERYLAGRPGASPVGLAYFGQISPQIFAVRGHGFVWFVPPALPGTIAPVIPSSAARPTPRLSPGLYAISASLVRGLPWRLYDAVSLTGASPWVIPTWRTSMNAFSYFQELKPLDESIGHSILLYEVSQADADRLNARYWPEAGAASTLPGRPVPED